MEIPWTVPVGFTNENISKRKIVRRFLYIEDSVLLKFCINAVSIVSSDSSCAREYDTNYGKPNIVYIRYHVHQ